MFSSLHELPAPHSSGGVRPADASISFPRQGAITSPGAQRPGQDSIPPGLCQRGTSLVPRRRGRPLPGPSAMHRRLRSSHRVTGGHGVRPPSLTRRATGFGDRGKRLATSEDQTRPRAIRTLEPKPAARGGLGSGAVRGARRTPHTHPGPLFRRRARPPPTCAPGAARPRRSAGRTGERRAPAGGPARRLYALLKPRRDPGHRFGDLIAANERPPGT